eukprot:CAMPEP_0183769294 /NCGR_PEP_ID=MMETSP0739-20130205/21002_1 /TAXON_ID=385413 /ORGANISM="Thalassiosira miniscula, Strain CCMP1093" /LENGTH=74 /DNA_ID=CAMNT_0026008847 /DNA_START=288 /DNA_END=509 /DNA_ORIENTATION=+
MAKFCGELRSTSSIIAQRWHLLEEMKHSGMAYKITRLAQPSEEVGKDIHRHIALGEWFNVEITIEMTFEDFLTS